MDLRDFVFYTFIGSAIWNGILAAMGYFLYTQQELLKKYYRDLSIAALLIFVIFLIYIVYEVVKSRKK